MHNLLAWLPRRQSRPLSDGDGRIRETSKIHSRISRERWGSILVGRERGFIVAAESLKRPERRSGRDSRLRHQPRELRRVVPELWRAIHIGTEGEEERERNAP